MVHKRWVRYHSDEWKDMVSQGWITMRVEEGMALLVKFTEH